jgi:hypothetical protein
LRVAGRQFRARLEGKRIAMHLQHEQDPEQLAEELHSRAEPLYRPAATATRGQPLGATHLVRIEHEVSTSARSFFDNPSEEEDEQGVIQWLAQKLVHDVELVGSEDEYKLTAVRTADLMESGYFAQYAECRRAYINHIQGLASDKRDPRERERERIRMAKRLHLFPAFVNAIEYEVRLMADENAPYRPFDARVVALLEDKDRFRQFFLLQAYGFIVEAVSADSIERWYELRLPGREPLYLTRPAPGEPDIFRAINTFVIARQDARATVTTGIEEQSVEQVIGQTQRDLVDAVYRLRQAMDERVAAPLVDSQNQARQDLGHLARLMYKEWIGHLRVGSPQVVGLLELEGLLRRRLEQFFACLAYGIIAEGREGNDRWYQLSTRRQRIYLSNPQPGEPDIFEAIATFTDPEKGRGVRPSGSRASIDFEEVEQALAAWEQNMVQAVRSIQDQRLADQGIVPRLRSAAGTELRHLSRLADLILLGLHRQLTSASPRVAGVLEYDRQDLVRDFFRGCAYGLIGHQVDRETGGQWLQLDWPGHQLCLTVPEEGRPDVFAAIETYVLVGEDARSEFGGRRLADIDYQRIGRLLQSKEGKMVEALQRLQEPERWSNVLWQLTSSDDVEYAHLLLLARLLYDEQARVVTERSPRVAALVDRARRERVEEILTCYAYGLVANAVEGARQCYRLSFEHRDWGRQDVYLTEPAPGRPSILKAVEVYLSGEEMPREGVVDRPQIEYRAVAEALRILEEADPARAAEMLKRQMGDEGGLVRQLQGEDSDERHLADLAYQLLNERWQGVDTAH